MTADMRRMNYAPDTVYRYVRHCEWFAAHFMRSPEEMGKAEIKAYVDTLIERPSAMKAAFAGLKFLYTYTQLGVSAELSWPRRPNQKGLIENLVGRVKGSFFKQRRFIDHDDMLWQFSQWLREINEERPRDQRDPAQSCRSDSAAAKRRSPRSSKSGESCLNRRAIAALSSA